MAAWLVGRTIRHTSAAVQHRVWLLALAGTLVVPALWALTPGWRMPLVTLHVPAAVTTAVTPHHDTWPELLMCVWMAGSVAGLAYLVLGIVAARRLFVGSRGTDNALWLELLYEAKREVGLSRPVELRFTDRNVSPAVWSFRRVRILLPDGCRSWPLEQRRSVLLHELAHAARWDCLFQLIAGVACAAWWFNPLIWVAAGRMRTLAEQAADDFVIRAGTRRSTYAEHLLAIAASLDVRRLPLTAAGMLQPSYLERRIRAILDPARRRYPLDRDHAVAGLLAACSIAVFLATATPSVVHMHAQAPQQNLPRRIDIQMELRAVPRSPQGTVAGTAESLARHLDVVPLVALSEPLQPAAPTLGQVPTVSMEIPSPHVQLLPNWEVGRHADALIPNWVVGGHAEVLIPGHVTRLQPVLVAGSAQRPPLDGPVAPTVKLYPKIPSVE